MVGTDGQRLQPLREERPGSCRTERRDVPCIRGIGLCRGLADEEFGDRWGQGAQAPDQRPELTGRRHGTVDPILSADPGLITIAKVTAQFFRAMRRISGSDRWCPQGDSNPCFHLERVASWSPGRWGLSRLMKRDRTEHSNGPAPSHERSRRTFEGCTSVLPSHPARLVLVRLRGSARECAPSTRAATSGAREQTAHARSHHRGVPRQWRQSPSQRHSVTFDPRSMSSSITRWRSASGMAESTARQVRCSMGPPLWSGLRVISAVWSVRRSEPALPRQA